MLTIQYLFNIIYIIHITYVHIKIVEVEGRGGMMARYKTKHILKMG